MSDHYYRFYNLDHRGSIRGARNVAFADDREALSHADRLLENELAIEVWQTDRLIGRVERKAPDSLRRP